MAAAYIGLAATVLVALIALFGTYRTTHAPQHAADVEGLARLVTELRAELDRDQRDHATEAADQYKQIGELRRQLGECWARVRDLEGEHRA